MSDLGLSLTTMAAIVFGATTLALAVSRRERAGLLLLFTFAAAFVAQLVLLVQAVQNEALAWTVTSGLVPYSLGLPAEGALLLVTALGTLSAVALVPGRHPTAPAAAPLALSLVGLSVVVLGRDPWLVAAGWIGGGWAILAAVLATTPLGRQKNALVSAAAPLLAGDLALLLALTTLHPWNEVAASPFEQVGGAILGTIAVWSRLGLWPLHGWRRPLGGTHPVVFAAAHAVLGGAGLALATALGLADLVSPAIPGLALLVALAAVVQSWRTPDRRRITGAALTALAGVALAAALQGNSAAAHLLLMASTAAAAVLLAGEESLPDPTSAQGSARVRKSPLLRAALLIAALVLAGAPLLSVGQTLQGLLGAALTSAAAAESALETTLHQCNAALFALALLLLPFPILRAQTKALLAPDRAVRTERDQAPELLPATTAVLLGLAILAALLGVLLSDLLELGGAAALAETLGTLVFLALAFLVWWRLLGPGAVRLLAANEAANEADAPATEPPAEGAAEPTERPRLPGFSRVDLAAIDLRLVDVLSKGVQSAAAATLWFERDVVEWLSGVCGRAARGASAFLWNLDHLLFTRLASTLRRLAFAGSRRFQRLHTGRLGDSLVLSTLSALLLVLVWYLSISGGSA